MKQRIRLTEEDLHRIVRESVNKVLMENAKNENVGKWLRAGVEAAGKKQRTNPQMQPYKGFGSSVRNWWNRTKENAQNEDDLKNLKYGARTLSDQVASNRVRNHMSKMSGSDKRYTMRPGATENDGYNPLSYNAGSGNYRHRGGEWRKIEDLDDF